MKAVMETKKHLTIQHNDTLNSVVCEPEGLSTPLVYLIVMLLVLSPLFTVGVAIWDFGLPDLFSASQNRTGFVRYPGFVWSCLLMGVALRMAAGVVLWKTRRWRSVRFVIGVVWIIIPLAYLPYVPYAITVTGSGFASTIADELFKSLFWPCFWTGYLLISKRVRKIYVR